MLGENLELILKIMNFGISNILCDYTKYRMSFLEKEVCNYIPDIRKLGIADITEDEFYKLIGLTHQEINQIKNPLTKEVNEEDEVEDDDDNDNKEYKEVKSKKTPMKLDEKIELVSVTEAIEDIPIAIPSPIPKKKRTIKKRPKLILIKNTQANRNKIEKQTLKRGGKSKKKTRKNKCNK